jgi:hypothetical protein
MAPREQDLFQGERQGSKGVLRASRGGQKRGYTGRKGPEGEVLSHFLSGHFLSRPEQDM